MPVSTTTTPKSPTRVELDSGRRPMLGGITRRICLLSMWGVGIVAFAIGSLRVETSVLTQFRRTDNRSRGVDGTGATVWQIKASAQRIQSLRDLNVLLYITTIFSDKHMQYIDCCWPQLMEYSQLLPNVHVTVFGNNATPQPVEYTDQIQSLFQPHNPSFQFKFATQKELDVAAQTYDGISPYQYGANLAMVLGFQNLWFQPYQWIIRINPDVLIRQSDWIIQTMLDESIDGIFVTCDKRKIHTDFFAIRVSSQWFNKSHNNTTQSSSSSSSSSFSNSTPFYTMVSGNHELTASKYFQPIIDSGRYRMLPRLNPPTEVCRVGVTNNRTSIVYHGHEGCRRRKDDGTAICKMLEGWDVN